MYQYDALDRQFVKERVAQYRVQTERYLAGSLSEAEFLQLRLRNGLYIQRLAPMLRVAVPYGTLSSTQLRALARISRDFDRGYGHLTTRQNVQFNWPELKEVPDILDQLADVSLHAIQTSGSCIRNVTTDEFAGVAEDEAIDPRPYCELVRQWSTSHPEFDWLPRKFKIAVTGAATDRAAVVVHDIGLRVGHGPDGSVVFDVAVGGGLGRTPALGSWIREGLPATDLLTYLEAILRVYNRYGRRDNKYKARIKILVRALSPETFREQVDTEWSQVRAAREPVPAAELERLVAAFAPPPYAGLEDATGQLASERLEAPAFDRFMRHNVVRHQQPGYAAVVLSTKATGIAPGDVSDRQMDAVADWAEQFGFGEIRISHKQNFVLPDVRQDQLFALWQAAKGLGLATANAELVTDVICCPGGDYCSLANAKSIPVAEAIQTRFEDYQKQHDLGPLQLNISGCMNACGHHHVGHIGILGVDKKGREYYQVSIGGNAMGDGAIGKIVGPSFEREQMVEVMETILETYVELREDGETFLDCYRRVGIEPFREPLYAEAA